MPAPTAAPAKNQTNLPVLSMLRCYREGRHPGRATFGRYAGDMHSGITVFRSADESAGEDAAKVRDMLAESGIEAALLDDSAPGVPAGAYEIRVGPADRERAEWLIARYPPEAELEQVDASNALDLVTVFGQEGSAREMEALQVQSILDAGGISSVLIGDSRYPNFGHRVRVAKEHTARAKQLIEEALAAGPVSAEEAERAGESSRNG